MIRIDPKKKVITVTSGTLEWRSLKDLEPLGIVLTKGKFQGVRQKYKTEDGGKFIESPTP